MLSCSVQLYIFNDEQINETFTIQLSQFAGGTDLLGNRTSVTITILKNDDANGVFSFTQDSLQNAIGNYNKLCMYYILQCLNIVAEIPPNFSGDMSPYRALFTVQRTRGLFGDVTVNWTVVNATSDVSPTEGAVTFRENDMMATFPIYSASDDV